MAPSAYNLTFQRPVVAEVTGRVYGIRGKPVTGALFGLGEAAPNPVSDVIGTIGSTISDFIGTLTGAKAQAQAQAQAVELARLQATRGIAEAQASSQLWGKALPWVAVGAVGLFGLVFLVARK